MSFFLAARQGEICPVVCGRVLVASWAHAVSCVTLKIKRGVGRRFFWSGLLSRVTGSATFSDPF
uniref:Uncharacterized protein n=1 Tax=Aegilops tauschii subsp. strangulata TaxID=200361 RepID=A0A453LRN9_AEGTS